MKRMMKKVGNGFVVFALFASLLAGWHSQPQAAAATLADSYGIKETSFSLAPDAFTVPDEGYLENIDMIEADDTNNVYVIANETYVNAKDIFHFTTDRNFLGRLITRGQLAAQLTGAAWNTNTPGAPAIEPFMMAFSKEGSERYLYMVLKHTNAIFPMIKLNVSTKTVVADQVHVFTKAPSRMQKGKDGVIYISMNGEWDKFYTLNTTGSPSAVTTVSTTLGDYIQSIVYTADGKYLVKGGVKAYICNELNLTTCTPLSTDNAYSHPSASENGEYSAIAGSYWWDNYLFFNGSEQITMDDAYSLDYSAIEFRNNGDLIVGLRESLTFYTYNGAERSYTFGGLLNSSRGEVYENDYLQMMTNPDNGHFFVADLHTDRLDEFDAQGNYMRSKAFTNDVGKVVYHDGYFFTLRGEGFPDLDILSAADFTLQKTISINPRDILWTPNGQFLALYGDKLDQYSWNAATKELELEYTYPVGGRYDLNMHGDGEQVTFTEENSENLYILNPNTHQYAETSYSLDYTYGVMDSSGFLIRQDWGNQLSILEPNYGTVYQDQSKLYSSEWTYYSKDTYLVPKKVYDRASRKYKMIPVLVQMTAPDEDQEASFPTVPEPQLYSGTLVTGTVLNLGINFPYNGTALSEIQMTDYLGGIRLFFTEHPETGININSAPDAIYHAVIGSEAGKRTAVIQFSNIGHSWDQGTFQLIFFEETGEIVGQAETHQATPSMEFYTYRLLDNGGYRGFPSGTAQSVNLVHDSFMTERGRPYIPILLTTGNTLTAPELNAPADKTLFDADEDEVILEWTNANDSADYDKSYLLLSTDPGFTSYQRLDVTGRTSYNLSTSSLIPGTPYYWKVLAVNTGSAEIAMSDTQQLAFKNWTVGLAIDEVTYGTAQAHVSLDTLNLNYFRKVGLAVSTTPNPTAADEKLVIAAPYQAAMDAIVNELQPNTVYYARAFAVDGTATRYSPQISFTTETFDHPLKLADVNFLPTVTGAVYSATVPYEVSVTNATYDPTKGIASAELWVEGVPHAWGTDIPLQVGLNTIEAEFTDAVGASHSTVLVTREAARLAAAPTNVTAGAGNGRATVRFDAPTDSGSYPIDKYVVSTQSGTVVGEGPTTEITVTGLANGTSYRFSVHAVTAAGDGLESGLSNAVTPSAGQSGGNPPPTAGSPSPTNPDPIRPFFDIWINGDGIEANRSDGEWRIVSSRKETDIKLEISQKAWTKLFVPQGFVQVEHQGIEYRFPVENVITDQMKQRLKLSGDTAYSVVLHLQVGEPGVQSASLPAGVVRKSKVITLKLEVQAGEQTAAVERFNRFAQLRFPTDSTDLTTAVRLDEKGIVHVPTKFIMENGRSFAELSLIGNGSFTMIQHSKSFNDIQGHWAEKQIQELANRRVVDGFADGSFKPNQYITRAQLAALTARALGLGEISYRNRFKDVRPEAWYANELEAAVAFDLLQGYENGSFQGDSLVTREQAIVVLNRIAKLTGIRVEEKVALAALTSFEDASQISSWAKADVGAAISAGIITGRANQQIAPHEWMTRAELSAILYRWLLHTDRQSY